jgi:hypothetical protein
MSDSTPKDPAKALSKEEQKKLLACTARLFADPEAEPDGDRERAALELVDFGPAGAVAVARLLGDAELRKHRKGMWALLHSLADLLSLDIPEETEATLVKAGVEFVLELDDNSQYVGWMAADALAQHCREDARPASVDAIFAGFQKALQGDHALRQMAGTYGLAAMEHPDSLSELVDATGGMASREAERYLARTLERLREGEPPEVFDGGAERPEVKVAGVERADVVPSPESLN